MRFHLPTSLPAAIEIHLMDNNNCCCISNLLPDNVLVEEGGFESPNPVIQDIMAFSHVLPNMSFLCQLQLEEAFSPSLWSFLTPHHPSSPDKCQTALKEENKRRKQERERGICQTHSEKSRYSSKYIISLDELIVWKLYIV